MIYDTTVTTALVYAFVDNSNTLTQVFNSSWTVDSNATVTVSPALTKIIFYGVSSSSLTTNLYFINYTASQYTSIDFPT